LFLSGVLQTTAIALDKLITVRVLLRNNAQDSRDRCTSGMKVGMEWWSD